VSPFGLHRAKPKTDLPLKDRDELLGVGNKATSRTGRIVLQTEALASRTSGLAPQGLGDDLSIPTL